MKFAIISDSHDNWPNIKQAIIYIKKQNIKILIHCGDISSGRVLQETAKLFEGEIHAITGNVSAPLETLHTKTAGLGVTMYNETGEIKIDGQKIAFNHYPPEAQKLADSQKYDLVFYGHDHRPWEKQIGKTKMLNPGTLAGLFSKATFAVYDTTTNKAELIILEKL